MLRTARLVAGICLGLASLPACRSKAGEPRAGSASHPGFVMPNPPGLGLPNPQAYQAMGSDLVRDQVTGLVWLKSPVDGFHTWDEATRACQDLSSGGEDDFRLPTRLELVTLVDFRYSDPAIDKTAFPGTPSEAFWTSSAVAGTPDHAWYVNFYFGSTDEAPTATASHARCVRGGS